MRRSTFRRLRGIVPGALIAVACLVVTVPALSSRLDPGRFAGQWTVAPRLRMSCTMTYRNVPLTGEVEVRRFTTAVSRPDQLTVTPDLKVEFFGVPIPGIPNPKIALPLDQTEESFGGSTEFVTDTAKVMVAMLDEVLVTSSGSVDVAGGLSGPNSFTTDISLVLTARVRVSETWQTADCTKIDGTYKASRLP
jgi:hypothetical protein